MSEETKPVANVTGVDVGAQGIEVPSKFSQLLEQVKSGEISIGEAEKKITAATTQAAGALIAVAQGPRVKHPTRDAAPSWVTLPADVKLPLGRQVVYVRFPSQWTATPQRGCTMPDKPGLYRWCAVWELTDTEENIAIRRAQGEADRVSRELAKGMIRVLDGHQCDWSGVPGPGNVDQFWTEIGSKCRQLMQRVYHNLHVLSVAETVDFFENCVESRIGV